MATPLHHAVTVTNIRNYIPVTLEIENNKYTSQVELFKIHCHAFQVLDHILPPAIVDPSSASDKDSTTKSKDQWPHLDATVMQWIYGTISKHLFITILTPGTTVVDAWKVIKHIFIDSKPVSALYIQQKFTNTKLENFANIVVYCQEIKNISNQTHQYGCFS